MPNESNVIVIRYFNLANIINLIISIRLLSFWAWAFVLVLPQRELKYHRIIATGDKVKWVGVSDYSEYVGILCKRAIVIRQNGKCSKKPHIDTTLLCMCLCSSFPSPIHLKLFSRHSNKFRHNAAKWQWKWFCRRWNGTTKCNTCKKLKMVE